MDGQNTDNQSSYPVYPTSTGGRSHTGMPGQGRGFPKWLKIVLGIAAVVLLSGFVGLLLLSNPTEKAKDGAKNTSDPAAATTLFDALGKAASQPNIRVAQLRQTFANKADLVSGTDPGFIQSSVSEVSPDKFRAVYAQRMYDKQEFSMERCMDGAAYTDGLGSAFGSQRPAPKTLAEANEYLKQMYRVTEAVQFSVCPYLGIMPGGTIDLAPSRLSDGFLPVTLTETQATNWKDKLKAANLFSVKDEGMVTREGKQLRKISFAPVNEQADVNQQLYDIFYETGEIEKIKRDHPKAQWQYEFIGINPANSGAIKGFYLIDEATKLPVYSELQGINPDKDKSQPVKKANIGFNKQTYAYPAALSLELTSPLEFLQ